MAYNYRDFLVSAQLKGSISDDELKNLHEQKKCEAVEEFKKDIEATVCGSPAYWIENLEQVIEDRYQKTADVIQENARNLEEVENTLIKCKNLYVFEIKQRAKEGLSEAELENLHKEKKSKAIEEFQRKVIMIVEGSPKEWIKDLDELIELLLE
ncbi:unnamed protein product [Enterobius vermicularis]|uniref:Uncharacterized protein n=1 Tax=Enterobius vermicularis TaxID=51028 RepID=A0A0N4UU44_ENTVE|nr:unnamed protein product [Enterobius vermicularis]